MIREKGLRRLCPTHTYYVHWNEAENIHGGLLCGCGEKGKWRKFFSTTVIGVLEGRLFLFFLVLSLVRFGGVADICFQC